MLFSFFFVMTGRAGTAKRVALTLYILIGEGVRGRGECQVHFGSWPVDDGKSWYSEGSFIDASFLKGEGV